VQEKWSSLPTSILRIFPSFFFYEWLRISIIPHLTFPSLECVAFLCNSSNFHCTIIGQLCLHIAFIDTFKVIIIYRYFFFCSFRILNILLVLNFAIWQLNYLRTQNFCDFVQNCKKLSTLRYIHVAFLCSSNNLFVLIGRLCLNILLLSPPSLYIQPCKVRAFAIKDQTTTAFEIKFEDSVVTRDKLLESLKWPIYNIHTLCYI